MKYNRNNKINEEKKMTSDKILQEITQRIRTIASNKDLAVAMDTEFENIEEWDSLNTVDLEMELESALDVSFETGEFGEFKTVKELVDSLVNKTA